MNGSETPRVTGLRARIFGAAAASLSASTRERQELALELRVLDGAAAARRLTAADCFANIATSWS